jgi:hypothetical protein
VPTSQSPTQQHRSSWRLNVWFSCAIPNGTGFAKVLGSGDAREIQLGLKLIFRRKVRNAKTVHGFDRWSGSNAGFFVGWSGPGKSATGKSGAARYCQRI